jgi:hypothetical protein
MNKFCTLCLAGLLANSTLFADDAALPSPPTEPLVSRAPAFSTWTVVYTPEQGSAGAPATADSSKNGHRFLKQAVYVKASDDIQETDFWSDGLKTQLWFFQGAFFFEQPGNPYVYIIGAAQLKNRPFQHDYTKSDFADVDWISQDNFKAVTSYQGRPCYLFQKNSTQAPVVGGAKSDAPMPVLENPSASAWIDGKTGLPLAVDEDKVLKVFSFQETPKQQLELPPRFAAAFQRYQTAIGAATVR